MNHETAYSIALSLGTNLYANRRQHCAYDAQENLSGRTHYAEPSTLKMHKARIVGGGVHFAGAAYRIVEVTALDYENTRRGYRAVLFDLTGRPIYRPELEECHRTKEQATRAFWQWLETFDPVEYYRECLTDRASQLAREIERLQATAADLEALQCVTEGVA